MKSLFAQKKNKLREHDFLKLFIRSTKIAKFDFMNNEAKYKNILKPVINPL